MSKIINKVKGKTLRCGDEISIIANVLTSKGHGSTECKQEIKGLIYNLYSSGFQIHIDCEEAYEISNKNIETILYANENKNIFPKWNELDKDYGYVIDDRKSSYIYMLYELTDEVARFCDYWDAPYNPECKVEIKKADWSLWKGKINKVSRCRW